MLLCYVAKHKKLREHERDLQKRERALSLLQCERALEEDATAFEEPVHTACQSVCLMISRL